jgi:hypothetical protein
MPLDAGGGREHHPAAARAAFFDLLSGPAGAPAAAAPAAGGVVEALRAAEPGAPRRALLEAFLCEQLAQVLRLSSSRLDVHRALNTQGLDSLMALEFRNRLEGHLGLTLPATLVWNYPTLALVGGHLADRLGIPLDGASPEAPDAPDAPPAVADGAGGAEAALDGLDAAAVEALLDDELAQVDALLGRP